MGSEESKALGSGNFLGYEHKNTITERLNTLRKYSLLNTRVIINTY
jgi:hypothetical protein